MTIDDKVPQKSSASISIINSCERKNVTVVDISNNSCSGDKHQKKKKKNVAFFVEYVFIKKDIYY